jgi:DNA-binding IclR family transcriptional regulator
VREHLRQHDRIGVSRRPDVVPPEVTRVMLALLVVYRRDGRATISSVTAETGGGRGNTHEHLHRLADDGLVAMGKAGALRPLIGPVKFGRRRRARRALTH